MDRHVLVSFLESVVFSDVVEVIASDHNCPLHFHLQYDTTQDTSSDVHVASEGALLVNVGSIKSLQKD